jgi:hypothetical protein
VIRRGPQKENWEPPHTIAPLDQVVKPLLCPAPVGYADRGCSVCPETTPMKTIAALVAAILMFLVAFVYALVWSRAAGS